MNGIIGVLIGAFLAIICMKIEKIFDIIEVKLHGDSKK